MVIGQHHGLPTRLMDWTYSPLAALHFATSREDITGMNQHDAVVWAIDITEMNTLLPAKYQKVLNDERAYLFTIDMQNAYEQLGLIIGETIEDDIVDKIFKDFCMGK